MPHFQGSIFDVDESGLSNFDPQDPIDLHRLWSVFSKATPAVESGRRYENLSWRLWSKEALCNSRSAAPSAAIDIRSPPQTVAEAPESVPDLSGSPDSDCSEASAQSSPSSPGHTYRSLQNSSVLCDQSRCIDRHARPVDIQKMVHSIKEQQDVRQMSPYHTPTSPPTIASDSRRSNMPPTTDSVSELPPASPRPLTSSTSTIPNATDSFESTASTHTSVSSNESEHSIVRGFETKSGITSYTSKCQLATPAEPTPILKSSSSSSQSKPMGKKNGMFMLGSGSSGDDEGSLRSNMSSKFPKSVSANKHASFNDKVVVAPTPQEEHPAVFDDSEDEDEDATDSEVSESAIDDDDDAWEDEASDPKEDDKQLTFHRVDSKAHLKPNRSLLTLNLERQNSEVGLAQKNNYRSTPALRRTTHNGPSMPASPSEQDSILAQKFQNMKTSEPIAMNQEPPQAQGAVPIQSPRTTKRNMLVCELSESLRKQMLNERKYKNPFKDANAKNAQIKRAHTSVDVQNMGRLPGISEQSDSNADWNHFFNNSSFGEYHQAGW